MTELVEERNGLAGSRNQEGEQGKCVWLRITEIGAAVASHIHLGANKFSSNRDYVVVNDEDNEDDDDNDERPRRDERTHEDNLIFANFISWLVW